MLEQKVGQRASKSEDRSLGFLELELELLDLLLEEVPDFLCVKDVRGHVPLNYIRKEHWSQWNTYLEGRKSSLRLKLVQV